LENQNLFQKTFIMLFVIITGCSSDENQNNDNESGVNISKMIKKTFHSHNNLGELLDNPITSDSIEYILSNNRIVSYTGILDIDRVPKNINGNFMYLNDKIYQIEKYQNNVILRKDTYTFINSDSSIEILSETPSSNRIYSKIVFTTQNDTTYSKNFASSDGINFSELIFPPPFKLMLDENDNRIYFEESSRVRTYKYNGNNLTLSDFSNGNIHSYTHGLGINTEALIHKNTFGKKINSILYDQGDATFNHYIFPVSPQLISENILQGVTIALGQNNPYTIENKTTDKGYSYEIKISQVINNIPFKIYSTELIFE